MPAAATYEPIATTTIGTAVASYSFNSIPSTYTDVILVANMTDTNGGGDQRILVTVNNDAGSNYSATNMYTFGASGLSRRFTSRTQFDNETGASNSATSPAIDIYEFMNYANTTTYKTVLYRQNNLAGSTAGTSAFVGLWRSTSAITSIKIECMATIAVGSSFTLYGIKAA